MDSTQDEYIIWISIIKHFNFPNFVNSNFSLCVIFSYIYTMKHVHIHVPLPPYDSPNPFLKVPIHLYDKLFFVVWGILFYFFN